MPMGHKELFCSLSTVALGFAALFYILNANLGGLATFVLSVVLLCACGLILQKLHAIEGQWGLLMLRTKAGLGRIDALAKKHPEVWNMLTDFGLVFGYGLLAYFLIDNDKKKPLRKPTIILLSIISLLLTVLFISPYIFPLAGTVISGLDVGGVSVQAKAAASIFPFFALLSFAMLIVGGLTLTTIVSIVTYGLHILTKLTSSIVFGTGEIANTPSGAFFLVPGRNLPLFEGIIALALLLVVHEAAHGVLSRVAKIKLKSAGLVLFGFLPVGAFVDPDENELRKSSRSAQLRVMVAGSTANILTAILSFLVLLGFVIGTSQFRPDALKVVSGALPEGTYVYSINGIGAKELQTTKFAPSQKLVISTEKGIINTEANKVGEVGVSYLYLKNSQYLASVFPPEFAFLKFVFNVLALLFVLNFLVGTVNLLPLPMFDGYHIVSIAIDNKNIVLAIMAVVGVAFVSNFLPSLFK